jgi:hypothetical protein
MKTTIISNGRTLHVESADGEILTKIEFAGSMVDIRDVQGIIKLNQDQLMELKAAWLNHLAEKAIDNQSDLNESWKA